MTFTKYFSVAISLLVIVPIFFLIFESLLIESDVLAHIIKYELTANLRNTFALTISVCALSAVIGVYFAWITTRYNFYGKTLFEKTLILPMAIPAYVYAFIYVGLLDYSGSFQSWLRPLMSYDDNLIHIRSLPGLILILTFSLYPYVYLITKSAFKSISQNQFDCSRSLGLSSRQTFFKLCLRSIKPWLSGALLLVAMECMADFGAAAIFGIDVFTTSIYKSWFGFHSIASASFLSLFLIATALLLVFIKSQFDGHNLTAYKTEVNNEPLSCLTVTRSKNMCLFLLSLIFTILTFIIPALQLIIWALEIDNISYIYNFLKYSFNTILLSFLGALACALTTFFLISGKRLYFKKSNLILKLQDWTLPIGYALPGAVLAVCIFLFMTFLKDLTGLTLATSSLVTLTLAYLIRFIAVSYNKINNDNKRIPKSYDEVAQTLGLTGLSQIYRLHLPLLKKSFLVGFILTFIDICKEMPLTLMTRPYGWDTLAIKIYEYTSEGEWELASLPAIAIVVIGLIPIVMLSKSSGAHNELS